MTQPLSQQALDLIDHAKRAANELYVEGIHEVAAALYTSKGEFFWGIHFKGNVGNADVCGEVAAICCMVSAGRRDLECIVALVRDGRGGYRLMSPCGRCREIISDFNPEARVIVGTIEHPYIVSIRELFPLKP
jgi:cytidine deaminase